MEFTARVQVDGWTFMPRFEFDRLDDDVTGEFAVSGIDFPVFAGGRGGLDQAKSRAVSSAKSFVSYVLSVDSPEGARAYFDALGVTYSLLEGQLVAQANG